MSKTNFEVCMKNLKVLLLYVVQSVSQSVIKSVSQSISLSVILQFLWNLKFIFLSSCGKLFFLVLSSAFRKCKKDCNRLKVILVQSFCPLKTVIAQFLFSFRVNISEGRDHHIIKSSLQFTPFCKQGQKLHCQEMQWILPDHHQKVAVDNRYPKKEKMFGQEKKRVETSCCTVTLKQDNVLHQWFLQIFFIRAVV